MWTVTIKYWDDKTVEQNFEYYNQAIAFITDLIEMPKIVNITKT